MASDIKCPLCGGKTTLRTRRSDKVKFYVCANFPKCKGQVAQDEVYWEEEEPNPVKSEPEPSKEVVHKETEQVKSASGIGWIAIGLICGIVTLISVFLPWWIEKTLVSCAQHVGSGINLNCIGNNDYYWSYSQASGWLAFSNSDSLYSPCPYPYFILPGAVIMIVFAFIIIVVILSNRSKAVKLTFGWLAIMSSLICAVASIWANLNGSNYYSNGYEIALVQYGAIVAAVSSAIAFIAFCIGTGAMNKRRKLIQ